jgi:hypothetical protein
MEGLGLYKAKQSAVQITGLGGLPLPPVAGSREGLGPSSGEGPRGGRTGPSGPSVVLELWQEGSQLQEGKGSSHPRPGLVALSPWALARGS